MSIMLPPGSDRNSGWRADDLTPDDVAPLLARFIRYFVPGAPDECWLWTGSRSATGYGHLHGPDRPLRAHRVAYVAFTGKPLVNQMTIDHLCNNPLCVNPDHLEVVSLRENVRRRNVRLGYEVGAKSRARSGRR